MSAARISRIVTKSVLAREQAEGAGATVRRSIGTPQLRNFTPFLMLDNFKVAEGAGFPDHPHRGMTTLTYLIEGEFEHEDFVGHRGRLGPGDLQFMIAGKGIMHAEMPIHGPGKKDPFGLQLWIDLPSQHKLVPPSYQELKAAEIPSANPIPSVNIKVICGEADGSESQGVVSSPVRPLGGCWFADVVFDPAGGTIFHRIPAGWNAFVYTLSGSVTIGPSTNPSTIIEPFHTAVLSNTADATGIQITSSGAARLVVVAGEPLTQEIFQHGPFVMDSQTGIRKAFQDYSMGVNGFEGAHDWKSEIGKKVS
ncbi:quercetin 2,3-dioxygenase, partial [Phenoliferia sp. Uapishka_3]